MSHSASAAFATDSTLQSFNALIFMQDSSGSSAASPATASSLTANNDAARARGRSHTPSLSRLVGGHVQHAAGDTASKSAPHNEVAGSHESVVANSLGVRPAQRSDRVRQSRKESTAHEALAPRLRNSVVRLLSGRRKQDATQNVGRSCAAVSSNPVKLLERKLRATLGSRRGGSGSPSRQSQAVSTRELWAAAASLADEGDTAGKDVGSVSTERGTGDESSVQGEPCAEALLRESLDVFRPPSVTSLGSHCTSTLAKGVRASSCELHSNDVPRELSARQAPSHVRALPDEHSMRRARHDGRRQKSCLVNSSQSATILRAASGGSPAQRIAHAIRSGELSTVNSGCEPVSSENCLAMDSSSQSSKRSSMDRADLRRSFAHYNGLSWDTQAFATDSSQAESAAVAVGRSNNETNVRALYGHIAQSAFDISPLCGRF